MSREIALKAIMDNEANVGVHEVGGDNAGQYVETYQRFVGVPRGSAWCAALQAYRIFNAAAGMKLLKNIPKDFPKSAWCPDYKDWAIKHGVWITVDQAKRDHTLVRRGDLCLFYFPAKARVAHIGDVSSSEKWGVNSVEGNTGPESGNEVQRNGDGIYRKIRSWDEFGYHGGFIRLDF